MKYAAVCAFITIMALICATSTIAPAEDAKAKHCHWGTRPGNKDNLYSDDHGAKFCAITKGEDGDWSAECPSFDFECIYENEEQARAAAERIFERVYKAARSPNAETPSPSSQKM